MKEAYFDCPYFDKCQENCCPLSSNYEHLLKTSYSGDKLLFNYHPCRLKKFKRLEIGKKHNLKNFGLKKREFSNYLWKYPQEKVSPNLTQQKDKTFEKNTIQQELWGVQK